MMDSLSLLATVQPAGTLTVRPSFESVVAPSGVAVGDATGLGVPPAGGGLGKSAMPPPEVLEGLGLPVIARSAPRPAMSTRRATTPAIISGRGAWCACPARRGGA